MKTNLGWIRDVKVKAKPINLSEKNTIKYFYDLGVDNVVFEHRKK